MKATLPDLLRSFSDTERLAPPALQQRQLEQLGRVLRHFEQTSPWLQERLRAWGLPINGLTASMDAWRKFPVMTRRDIQSAGESLHARNVPAPHLPVVINKSSGSTGEPVSVRRTALTHLFWRGATLRDHIWHERDARGTLASIRANLAQATTNRSWGPPVSELYQTGSAFGIPSNTDVARIADLLLQAQPNYLLIYPSIWSAVLDDLRLKRRAIDSLWQVRTIGETVSEELRRRTRLEAGVEIADVYSAEEVGTVAIQCAHSGLYHTMAEYLLVEVLRADGSPCEPGEVGRVVVTDLYNYATPIIRYENGDYAEVGPACTCGRSLPTLHRILGRERNMVQLPDGRRYWPTTGYREFATVADVRQYQLVQTSLQDVEVRLVVESGRLDKASEDALAEIISRWLGHPFHLHFVYFDEQIPRHKSGKFEEFICAV